VSDIFQEVEEDLRRDKASALWAKYQNLVYAVVALVVLGTAGTTAWRIYDRHAREEAGAAYLAAQQATQQDPKAAIDVFAGLAAAGSPVAGLARFDMARSALLAGDRQQALDVLVSMAGDAKLDQPMRGAAAVMGGHLALDLEQADAAEKLVEPLLVEGNAYRLLALEVTGLAALAEGDEDHARQVFDDLAPLAEAPEAPAGLSERVSILRDRLAQ